VDLGDVIARNVRAQRAWLKIRQADLGERLGWLPQTVSALESGERATLVKELPALCKALECQLSDLLRGADPEDLRILGL
jgi:DNA-binding Xre family transcriptional regulator